MSLLIGRVLVERFFNLFGSFGLLLLSEFLFTLFVSFGVFSLLLFHLNLVINKVVEGDDRANQSADVDNIHVIIRFD